MTPQSLRIVILTMSPNPPLSALLESGHQVVGIVQGLPRAPRGWRQHAWKALSEAWARIQRRSLAGLAKRHNIPFHGYSGGQDKEFKPWLERLNPDLMVVIFFNKLLPKEIFRLPPLGTINLHPSLLPAYRGPNPVFWAYFHMERESGFTVHYLDEGEDTGDILNQSSFEIPFGEDHQALLKRVLATHGAPLLLQALESIATGNITPRTQPAESPTCRASNLGTGSADLVDWMGWPARRIWHLLQGNFRGLSLPGLPPPCIPGQFWEPSELQGPGTFHGKPGEIFRKGKDRLLVCREGAIMFRCRWRLKHAIRYISNR